MISSLQKIALIALLICEQTLTIAQTVDYSIKSYTKPIKLEKIHVETSVGISVSHLNKYYDRKPLISPYSEINLIVPLSYHVRLRSGFTYQVIGSVDTYSLPDGLYKASRRLPYLSSQTTASYILSNTEKRILVEIQGGVFLAKKLDDETVNVIPNSPIIRNKSLESSINFNSGLVLGSSVSIPINRIHRIGIKFLYHQGIIDIRTKIAKQNTGSQSLFTQAFTICSYFSI